MHDSIFNLIFHNIDFSCSRLFTTFQITKSNILLNEINLMPITVYLYNYSFSHFHSFKFLRITDIIILFIQK